MVKRIAYVLFILVMLLPGSGCNSFNKTYLEVSPTTKIKNGQKVEISGLKEIVPSSGVDVNIIKAPPATQEGVPRNWCPPYHPPKLPAEPLAPIDTLASIPASDVNAVERLSAAYTVELHNYIKTTQALQSKSYNDYVVSCRSEQKRRKM